MSAGRASPPGGDVDPSDDDLNGPDEETVPEGPEAPAPAIAAAAPTATTTALPGRGRRIVLAFLLLILGAAAVAVVLYLSGDYQQGRELKKEAEAILVTLSDGKADEVYEGASSRFQQTQLIDRFADMVTRMNATLGRFVRATGVLEMDRAAGVAGMTARVVLDLEYEKGPTRGQLSFLRGQSGRWLLLGFNVEIPADLVAESERLEAMERRGTAPKEVIDLVHSMLESVREGRAAEVYERASPGFKSSVSAEGFAATLRSHHASLGNFVRVLKIISSAQGRDGYQASVQALLEYEKGKTTGTFEFMRIGQTWRMFGFKVVIPFGDALPAE